jgi:hypothetical protein
LPCITPVNDPAPVPPLATTKVPLMSNLPVPVIVWFVPPLVVHPVLFNSNSTLVTVPLPGTDAVTKVTISPIVHFLVSLAGSVADTSENTNKSETVGVADGYVYIIGMSYLFIR